MKVLFIGNSFTYYNDLPAMVQAMADAAGERESLLTFSFIAPSLRLQAPVNRYLPACARGSEFCYRRYYRR